MAMEWIDLLRLHEAIGFMDDAEHFAQENARGK